MPKNPDKIREQINKLQADLEQAEQERVEKNQHKIAKAAERSGLDHVDLTASALEREFRQLAKRMRDDTSEKSDTRDAGHANDDGNDSTASNLSNNTPTSTTLGDYNPTSHNPGDRGGFV